MSAASGTDGRLEDLVRRSEGLAGRSSDLPLRARVYRRIWEASGRNHVFPLLASHGALWGVGYFERNMLLGAIVSWQHVLRPDERRRMVFELHEFADRFREINRLVCAQTCLVWELTARPELRELAEEKLPTGILEPMDRCHRAASTGRRLDDAERRGLFEVFFAWEQETIVGPLAEEIFAAYACPVVKARAHRPEIAFGFLREAGVRIRFDDFTSTAERTARGLAAYDAGARIGWEIVERSLDGYGAASASAAAVEHVAVAAGVYDHARAPGRHGWPDHAA